VIKKGLKMSNNLVFRRLCRHVLLVDLYGSSSSTAFFFIERDRVAGKWKTSLTVSGLVTLIAAVHYFYMRDVWVATGTSPTEFRYIDWLLTVPLLMVEFYLVLSAVTKVPAGVFWRLLVGSVAMLVFGYAGETGMMNATACVLFSNGRLGIHVFGNLQRRSSQINAGFQMLMSESLQGDALCVTLVGLFTQLGYFMGYMGGGADPATLNIVYNLADFVNKIGFGVIIWAAAVADSE